MSLLAYAHRSILHVILDFVLSHVPLTTPTERKRCTPETNSLVVTEMVAKELQT